MTALRGRAALQWRSMMNRTRRAQEILRRPTSVLLILILVITSVVPLALDSGQGGNKAGAIVDSGAAPDPTGTDQGSSAEGPSVDTPSGPSSEPSGPPETNETNGTQEVMPTPVEHEGSDDFNAAARSSNLTVEQTNGGFTVWTKEYSIVLYKAGNAVQYEVHPYFTDDFVRYGRLDPLTSGEGTVDEFGNALDWVSTTISDWGQAGNCVWFKESCAQFSLVHEFTIFRDYFELNVTYAPGIANVVTTYMVGLYDSNGLRYNMFADGQSHRYIPGVPEDTPITNGIGGWFPAYMMFAPAFDMRAPGKSLGVEWGYDETEAYLYSPVWTKGMTGMEGASAFGLKYTSTDSVLPDPSIGQAKVWHMFVRPYEYTDGQPRGHDAGYAKWVAPNIAESWGYQYSPQFPLTFNDFGQYINGQSGQWDAATRAWVESSPILVSTLSSNPEQVNWHYKSAQQMMPQTGPMPTEWQLWSSPNHPYTLANGHPVPNAASASYRDHLINGDPYNDWWWSSTGVFWDEMNSWYGENNLPRSDYNKREEFIYDGYLRLVQESRASGNWDFVISNPYTAQIQLAMLSDLTLVEGFEPVPTYNIDLKANVLSTMVFVNEMPSAYRPHIVVYQNYAADSPADQAAVYSVLFNAARYGFSVDLLSYAPYAAQMHNLQMAVDMFKAMGADRRVDPTIWPATLDMATEGHSITTDRSMVVVKGSGNLAVEFTKVYGSYALTNLGSSPVAFTMTLPSGSFALSGAGITQTSVETLSDGRCVLHGLIAAEATAGVVLS